MKIALVDDTPLHLKRSLKLCENALKTRKVLYLIRSFASAEELLAEIKNHTPDIAVLDIEMPKKDGISLAKEINLLAPDCRIIFLTSYIEYASDVYETEHIWFVVKKSADKYFDSAIDKALKSLQKQKDKEEYIVVKAKGISKKVPLNSILYLSKVDRKAAVFCDNGEYYDRRRPAELIPDELAHHFVRCHQGYWVNIQRIKEIDHDDFILDNDIHVPISRTFSKNARDAFFSRYYL